MKYEKINDTLNLLSKLNLTRIFNFIKIYSGFYYSRISEKVNHKGMPFSISMEPTTHCNLHCPECPTGLKQLTRPSGNISIVLYKKIIDELHKHLIYLTLYFQGEPFLNKQFFELTGYAVSKKIYTSTSTNGHFLDDDNCKQIIESGLDRLIISMDGTTQETYSSYRIGGNINTVKEGIKNLIFWKKKLKSTKPYTILQFLVLKSNQHQIDEIKAFATLSGINELQLKSAQFYDPDERNELIPDDTKYSRYTRLSDNTYKIKSKLLNHCFRMWSSAVITWDGNVVPCCFDKDAKYCFGNLNENTFAEIWDSNEYNRFREKILKGRKSLDICCNCVEGI